MQRVQLRDARGKQTEVYVGRPVYGARGKRVRNGHILANPFPLKSRDTAGHMEAVEKYRHWLWQRIKDRNQPVLQALAALRPESVLLCYCHSNQPCHADVIIKAWHYCWQKEIIPAPATPWQAPDRSRPRTTPILFALSDKQTYTRTTTKGA